MAMVVFPGMATNVRAQQVKPVAPAPSAVKSVAVVAPAEEKSAPMETEWDSSLPAGTLTMGVHFGDQQAESFGDILVPVVQFKSGLLFVNPRGSWNDSDGQEFNFGVGYRHLFPDRKIIVGGNLFYDLRNTSLDNTFNQFGGGLEFLSTWFDARVNVYLPESGKKTADEYTVAEGTTQEQGNYWYEPTGQGHLITQYGYDVTSTYDVKTLQHYQIVEQAMEGYDFELGALLPIPVVKNYADIKVFGGYYDYNAHYGNDISGVKGRVEIKPLPSLYLDAAWFEDKDLIGSHYSVGARVSVPFDLANLSRGKNPFAGAMEGFKPGAAKPDFASRMTEMVVRDLHVRTDVSQPEEVVQDRRILEKTLTSSSRKDYNLVLASDVTFVDDDNRSGVENGTWENPYRQINTGVQSAIGTMVYVRDAAQQYYENVVLRDGLTLWGSGAPIYGQGNRFLGGIYPVVNGLGRGPAITLANNVTVAGFEITQEIPYSPSPDKNPTSMRSGIYGNNVTDVNIYHNYIHNTDGGIQIHADSIPSFTANITDNRIEDISSRDKGSSTEGGIGISLFSVPKVDLTLANNNVTRCEGSGVAIYADDGDSFIARISGNYSGNLEDGVSLYVENYGLAAGLFVDTTANGNRRDGINADFYNNSVAGALFASHADIERIDQLVRSVVGALNFLPLDLGSDFSVADLLGVKDLYRNGGVMQANGNGGAGINVSQQSSDINLAALIGVQADGNGVQMLKADGGSGVQINQAGSAGNAELSIAALIHCQANDNRGSGMAVRSSADTLALNVFVDVTANDNLGYGICSYVNSEKGWAGTVVLASDPLLSLIETVSGSPLVADFVSPMDLSFIPAYGQVQANGNGGSGILIDATAHDGAFGVVLDAQANGNGFYDLFKTPNFGNGIEVNVTSTNGPAIGVVGSTEALMALVNTVLDAEAVPLDLSKVRTLGSLQANDNADYGVSVNAYSEKGDAIVGLLGVDALRNGFGRDKFKDGDGISINAVAGVDGGDAMVGLAWINASGNGGDGIYANVRADSVDREAMLGGIHINANDNGHDGLDLNIHSQSPDSSYLVLAGVDANRNIHGSGIDAWVSAEGEVMVAMTDIQANDNGSHGIWVETDSHEGDSAVWISGNAVQDMNDYGGGLDLLGLDLISLFPSGTIEANNNGDNGIYINSSTVNGDVWVNVNNVTASGNQRHGVLAELNSTSGNVYAAFSDIVANNNNNGLRIEANSSNSNVVLLVNHVTASGNTNNGINAILTSYVEDATFSNNTMNLNGDNGLKIDATSTGGDISLNVAGNTANDNNANGIRAVLSSINNIDSRFTDNVTSGNGEDGLHINASASQQLKLLGEWNTATDNGDDGIDVKTSAANGTSNRQYDFGGGVLGSEGNNTMADNGDYDMERSGNGAFSAQYNYWDGIVPPVNGNEFTGKNMDVANALLAVP